MNAPTDRDPNECLRLDHLTKEFESNGATVKAVNDASLSIRNGEFLTLLGPSGCGKTTMLRMIAGFEEPTSGAISLNGRNMVGLPANKRPMAMVFQNYALFPHLSVFENVAYGLRLKKQSKGEIRDTVEVALASMNLSGLGDRDPHQLSGGQQQRVALARAMVMKPDVLLFDEPLSNLDAKLRAQMRLEIRQLQRRLGITTIYVTHDQGEAMSLSDRVVVMNRGRIEQLGTPTEIYHRPKTLFVADFIGTANFLTATVDSFDGPTAKVTVLDRPANVPTQPEVQGAREATLLVRPESVVLTADSDRPDGTVTQVVYLGSSVEYGVDTSIGVVFAVEANPDPDHLLAEGTPVRIALDDNRCFLLADRHDA